MPDEDLEKLAEEAKNYPYPPASKIDVDFFEINPRANKAKIIFNEDVQFKFSTNENINYTLREPLFINRIVVIATESKANSIGIFVTLANGEKKECALHYLANENKYISYIDLIAVNFEIVIKKWGKLNFKKIEVFGRFSAEIDKLEKISKDIKTIHEELKTEAKEVINTNKETLDKIQKAQEELNNLHTSLDEEIETFKQEIEALAKDKASKEKEVATVQTKLDTLKAQTAQVQNNHDNLVTKEQTLKDSIEQKNHAVTELNKKIVQEEQKLKEHEKDTNLIAYDVKGFVENAKSNIKVYIGLSVLPWILICAISIILACNADKIAGYALLEQGKVDLATVFWTRIPFAIIVSTILYVSYEISIAFARKIIDLHQRILDLQKIGIIAKDVSEASLTNLEEFTDEEKYELRTKLKMDLLRSHLAKDFHIKDPFKVTNPSLLTRFLKAKDTPKEKASQEEAKVKPEEAHAEE